MKLDQDSWVSIFNYIFVTKSYISIIEMLQDNKRQKRKNDFQPQQGKISAITTLTILGYSLLYVFLWLCIFILERKMLFVYTLFCNSFFSSNSILWAFFCQYIWFRTVTPMEAGYFIIWPLFSPSLIFRHYRLHFNFFPWSTPLVHWCWVSVQRTRVIHLELEHPPGSIHKNSKPELQFYSLSFIPFCTLSITK